jgi:hypothetical protein
MGRLYRPPHDRSHDYFPQYARSRIVLKDPFNEVNAADTTLGTAESLANAGRAGKFKGEA